MYDDFLFTSVYMKEIETTDDLAFIFNDFFCRNNYEYQYKLEYRNENGGLIDSVTYNIVSRFDVLVICDADEIWYTPLNVSAINFNTVRPYTVNTPIFATKPSYYSYTATNYEEGSCTGIFLKMTGEESNIQFETEHNWKYRKQFKNWLTLGNAKIIKSVSGEAWIVGIKSDAISDTSLFSDAEIDGARLIEFGWIEIGDIESEADLYENDFINVPSDDWSGV